MASTKLKYRIGRGEPIYSDRDLTQIIGYWNETREIQNSYFTIQTVRSLYLEGDEAARAQLTFRGIRLGNTQKTVFFLENGEINPLEWKDPDGTFISVEGIYLSSLVRAVDTLGRDDVARQILGKFMIGGERETMVNSILDELKHYAEHRARASKTNQLAMMIDPDLDKLMY